MQTFQTVFKVLPFIIRILKLVVKDKKALIVVTAFEASYELFYEAIVKAIDAIHKEQEQEQIDRR